MIEVVFLHAALRFFVFLLPSSKEHPCAKDEFVILWPRRPRNVGWPCESCVRVQRVQGSELWPSGLCYASRTAHWKEGKAHSGRFKPVKVAIFWRKLTNVPGMAENLRSFWGSWLYLLPAKIGPQCQRNTSFSMHWLVHQQTGVFLSFFETE